MAAAMKLRFLPLLLLTALSPALAQGPTGGTATLVYDGRELGGVGYQLRGDGPRFDPLPVARALEIEVQVGPLGDSHAVVLDQKKVVFGPDNTTLLSVPKNGGREQVSQLSAAPVRDAAGIKVPLELLERVFGEERNVDIRWNAEAARLEIASRVGHELVGAVQVVHQYRVSTVEIEFSAKPKFRVEKGPSRLDIRILGDTFRLRTPFANPGDPLVKDVVVLPRTIRLELAEDAATGEPRLLEGSTPSLVIEVFKRVQPAREALSPETSAPSFSVGSGASRAIVIDPGHGGSETGATANGLVESQLTLQVARLLKSRLEQKLPVRVVLTRNDDSVVPHAQRVALANQNKGELFISLHFNSYSGSRARGAETYFLSRQASDKLAESLADAENAADPGEGAGPSEGLDLILWDLAQSHHLSESQRFATLVQQELNTTLGLPDRGVRQAPFRVLVGTNMPAVLVELGFISNAEEAARLQDPIYLDELAGALVRAVIRFRSREPVVPAEGSQP
jgi:N-acetylmuramoyl-L-alanine amidase